ncbi:hypothetical protein EDB83DRAFT_870018 [Lactarius deliciosus]|nr:hypothetical protein EDB83DRAFT_870018 [Lactarius deliciosus]
MLGSALYSTFSCGVTWRHLLMSCFSTPHTSLTQSRVQMIYGKAAVVDSPNTRREIFGKFLPVIAPSMNFCSLVSNLHGILHPAVPNRHVLSSARFQLDAAADYRPCVANLNCAMHPHIVGRDCSCRDPLRYGGMACVDFLKGTKACERSRKS